jgi:hypothetical protein
VVSLVLAGRLNLDFNSTVNSVEAESIQINGNASITARATYGELFSNIPSANGAFELLILYDKPTDSIAQNLPSEAISYIQVGNVGLPGNGVWDTCAWSASYSNSFPFNSTQSQSFLVSVHRNETYVLSTALGPFNGVLESGGQSSFPVFNDSVFLPNASFVPVSTSLPSSPTATPARSPSDESSQSSPIASVPSSSPWQSPAESAPPHPEAKGLPPGAIVGIVLGLCCIIAVACVALWIYRRAVRPLKSGSLNSSLMGDETYTYPRA